LGLAIVAGWIVVMVAINDYDIRRNFVLLYVPIVIGWILVSLGITKSDVTILWRIIITILLASILSFLSIGFMAFLFIGRYGLTG